MSTMPDTVRAAIHRLLDEQLALAPSGLLLLRAPPGMDGQDGQLLQDTLQQHLDEANGRTIEIGYGDDDDGPARAEALERERAGRIACRACAQHGGVVEQMRERGMVTLGAEAGGERHDIAGQYLVYGCERCGHRMLLEQV